MTDPTMADATYVEPVEWQTVSKIIEQGAAGCPVAYHGWSNCLELCFGLGQRGSA